MNIQKHIILFVITILVWAIFYFMGLPFNYFVDWNLAEKTLLSLVTAFAILPFIGFFVILFLGGDYFKVSIWFAFYASVLIFVMDFIVVGLIEGHGISFLISHWPQTIAYVYVWIPLPLVGIALKKISEEKNNSK